MKEHVICKITDQSEISRREGGRIARNIGRRTEEEGTVEEKEQEQDEEDLEDMEEKKEQGARREGGGQ